MASTLKDQLYGVRRKIKQTAKRQIKIPAEFTFNRGGVKYFDQVLKILDWNIKNVPVEIDFTECRSANYQAVALLIPYCWKLKQQGCTISFKLENDGNQNGSRVWSMMGAHGLFAVTTDPKTNFKSNEHKPLFAIRNSDDFKLGLATADEFTAGFGVEYQKTLRYVLSELLYNLLEHGKSDFSWKGHRYPTPGALQFTWYEKVNELHFIVADIGVGVKAHLSQGYPGLATDEEALRLAVQPEISGTFGKQDPYSNRNNAGMGLFLSSNIIRRLRADMHLISGNGVLHISPVDTTGRTLDTAWPGTFALVTVRLDRGTEFALDAMMSDFRAQARAEVKARSDANEENRHYLSIYNYFGRYADDKQAAISYRDKHLLPAVAEGKTILVDFNDVETSTHSFLNALFASPIRRMGLRAYKRIRVINASKDIRETIDYVLDDNTGDGADDEKYE
ncbi:STAS-like domain-containing protein [Paraburkholderia sp. D15]|uniref:STAS-like domain-containing protein n=1 Tax=Paraburkholderia sp. D15 TaxID=2880218 RepID=UPI002479CCAC|nr:STAS-like domain-containing protein [Paraburkholderia sp. D15]WGS50872.1 STAS-like domain-containing protein [Paraburkholderia sp. D15]